MDRESILAEALGAAVKLEDWQKYMQEGFVVEIKIKRWRARKKLTLYELGIIPPDDEASDAYDDLINLGTNALLPTQKLKDLETIERNARQCLKNHSYNTPFGRFVPYTAWTSWKSANEGFKQRFMAMRDQMVAEYDDLVDTLLNEYATLAKHAYFLLREQYYRKDDYSFTETFSSESAFVRHFQTNLIARHIKTADQFRETFVYTERFTRIELGALSLDREQITEPETWLGEREAKRAAAEYRRDTLMQMERDLVAQVRSQKKSMIDQFLESLMVQTRTLTYDAVTSVLQSVQKEDSLQGRPVIQLRELIKKIEQLNFWEDSDIDRMLTSLHAIIKKPSKTRDLSEIQRQLRAMATLSRATVLALGDEAPRTEKEIDPASLGISAFPSEEEVREAREEIASIQPVFTSQAEEEREEREDEPIKRVEGWTEPQRVERE